MVEITDGTSNTISLVEAKRVIPWTEPRDIVWFPSPEEPRRRWGAGSPKASTPASPTGRFNSSRPPTTRPPSALFTIAGAEPVKPKLVDEGGSLK